MINFLKFVSSYIYSVASAMETFEGIKEDVKGRVACYKEDWKSAITSGVR